MIPHAALLDLTGRVALVTGAGGTIGTGIARRLHAAGASVMLHAHRDAGRLSALADSLPGSAVVAGDVQRDATGICQATFEALGALHIVVNNAGIQPVAALLDLTSDDELEMLRVNVGGITALTRAAALAMTASDSGETGCVVNVSSIEGLQAAAGHSHYAASKAAVIMHTRAAALELGPRGIRVNAVAPGLIDNGALAEQWPEGVARWHAAAPLQRLGTPDDIADAVLFLASPAARWITGSTLVVDGGVLAHNTW